MTKWALNESEAERKETSQQFAEISQRLTNSGAIAPGPNVNKPRVARPQNTAYQSAVRSILEKEKDENEEGVKNDEKDVFKIFSHLANVLNETAKTDVNLPPKFYGDDKK